MQIPSPVQRIEHPVFKKVGVNCFLKRDDLIHPVISGNKWRKLKHNIEAVKRAGEDGFITFGGAYSNHLAASALAAKFKNLNMIAVVRGEEDRTNSTLDFIQSCGAQVLRISRQEYARKDDPSFLEELSKKYPGSAIIPEGGANGLGVRGCSELLSEVNEPFDLVACPMGSATTFSGLVLSAKRDQSLIGFPALKGGEYLSAVVHNFISQAQSQDWLPSSFTPPEWRLETAYHFGGFGKVNSELVDFMNGFWKDTGIPLDPLYTAKMMYGILEMVKVGRIAPGTRILAIHSGGLQGIKGMNDRLRKRNLEIEYEEAVSSAFTYPDF